MSKKSAAIALMVLVVTLVAVNTVVLPQLSVFLKVGTVDSMFKTGMTVGTALAGLFSGVFGTLMPYIGGILFVL